MEPIPVAMCVGCIIEQAEHNGKTIEATTTGKFMMPDGEKAYNTFLDMLRDQPQLPDPVFEENDVLPTIEDAGFPLDKMEEHDAEFKKMYDEMFSRQSELGKMGAGDIETRMAAYQNELSESKVENINGGSTHNISTGGSPMHSPQRPSTPLYYDEPDPAAGVVIPTAEEGGDEHA